MPPSGFCCHSIASRRADAVSSLLKIQTFCLDIRDAFIEVLIKFWSIFRVSFLLLEEAEVEVLTCIVYSLKTDKEGVFEWLGNVYSLQNDGFRSWNWLFY